MIQKHQQFLFNRSGLVKSELRKAGVLLSPEDRSVEPVVAPAPSTAEGAATGAPGELQDPEEDSYTEVQEESEEEEQFGQDPVVGVAEVSQQDDRAEDKPPLRPCYSVSGHWPAAASVGAAEPDCENCKRSLVGIWLRSTSISKVQLHLLHLHLLVLHLLDDIQRNPANKTN